MTFRAARYCALLLLVAALLRPACLRGQGDGSAKPVTDPPLDTLHPPSQVSLSIPSHGVPLNGFVYLPQGTGRHHVVVFVHGLPGVEKNLDLAQAVRRAGYAVVYFDFRGLWGTGGTFSFGNSLEDVGSVLAWLRTPAVADRYGLDPGRLALVGHSFGGWLALTTFAADPAIACAAAFAPGNRPGEASGWSAHSDQRQAWLATLQSEADSLSGPIRARAEDVVAEIEAHEAIWDLVKQVPGFRDRPLLLVTGSRDLRHMAVRDDLRAALSRAGATHFQDVVVNDDHTFDATRMAAARLLVDWLGRACRL